MLHQVRAALGRIQEDLARVLGPQQIAAVCREVDLKYRKRILDPITTIHLFVTQVLHGNFAVARLREFTDCTFSEAAYCKAARPFAVGGVPKTLAACRHGSATDD